MSRLPGVIALAASGVFFALFPILRPYSPETGLAGAETFASTPWLIAHLAGMAGFVLLVAGVSALRGSLRVNHLITALGVALVLPYFGAETFGLQALGVHGAQIGDPALIDQIAEQTRYAPVPMVTFGLGLVLVAVSGVLIAVRQWRTPARLPALLTGIGLVTYLPQFFLPGPGRIAHGVVLAAGLIWLAVATERRDQVGRRAQVQSPTQPAPATH